jgi:hypothetical protein
MVKVYLFTIFSSIPDTIFESQETGKTFLVSF